MSNSIRRPYAASFAWVLLAIAPLAGCGGEEEPPTGGPSGAAAGAAAPSLAEADQVSLAASSARGNFQIRIRPEGGSIPLNEPFAVIVDLIAPGTGDRLEDYGSVTLDARMPAHGHGMLRDVELVPNGEGALRAEGLLFHMIGHWEFHVDMTRGLRTERAQVSYELTL